MSGFFRRGHRPAYSCVTMRRPLLPLVAVFGVVAPLPAASAQEVGRREGQFLPDLELPTIDGKQTLRLSDFRGKKLLLIEFASW